MTSVEDTDCYKEFLQQHQNQLTAHDVPKHYWPAIYEKLTSAIFDAGSAFKMFRLDYDGVAPMPESPVWTVQIACAEGIKANDPNSIYLIDHAWTFSAESAKYQLNECESLRQRMGQLTGVECDDSDANATSEKILSFLWKHAQMYTMEDETEPYKKPIWYVMDELGSAVNHSDTPNFRVVPLVHLTEQITYSLLYPLQDVEEDETVTRDFAEGITDPDVRKAVLLPWKYNCFADHSYVQIEEGPEYFLQARIEESLPDENACAPILNLDGPLKVFTQYSIIKEYLTDPAFEVTDDQEEADILWLTTHFKSYKQFSVLCPNRYVNQFPFENVLTIKDLLPIVCRRNSPPIDEESLESHPKWLPTTFNLKTELVKFVSYYQSRLRQGLDNHWIIKPWNLARGLDTHITKNIWHIVSLQKTGPKIAQKYIDRPVLFNRADRGRVKFDIRYVILLKSVEPLEAYIYTNFFLRFSNKPFNLDNLHDYQQHFTVMNYSEDFQLCHIKCEEFQRLWEVQYPDHSWCDIEEDICTMLREVFERATAVPSPCGIAPNPQSRAVYAADIMLEWDSSDNMQTKLLEVNWMPDCQRACEYYPDFYNDIFKLLFLDNYNEEVFKKFV